jgi:hypothetical protein
MKRTVATNKKLYALFSELGITKENKELLVLSFTNNRTIHSSEMTETEAQYLIEKLQRDAKTPKMSENQFKQTYRRNVFKLMYDIGLINANMTTPEKTAFINNWIKNKLKLGKELNALTLDELIRLINQLQAVRRNYINQQQQQAMYN